MKALSVRQPWAGLTMIGAKTIELRSWSTSYRGALLICATKKEAPDRRDVVFSEACKRRLQTDYGYQLDDPETFSARGLAVCVVELVECRPMLPFDEERSLRPFDSNLFAWVTNPSMRRRIRPFPVRGRLSLFDVNLPERT